MTSKGRAPPKYGSGSLNTGDLSAGVYAGGNMPPFQSAAAPSTVKQRNSMNFQAASWCLLCFGMTHSVPPHWPVSLGADLPHKGHGMRPILPDSSGACFLSTMADGTFIV